MRIIKALINGKKKNTIKKDQSNTKHEDYQYLLSLMGVESLPEKYNFCLSGINFIKKLDKKVNAKFYFHLENLRAEIQGITYEIDFLEELLILDEVFVEGVYNFNVSKPFIFIDVGMNVGITSLSVSKNSLCKKIVAYEPFMPTIEKALKNFSLNKFSDKIQLNKHGLGFPGRTINVEYSKEHKGSVGINGVASYVRENTKRQLLDLQIIDVKEALTELFKEDEDFIMKIDCEGAEYEIIKRLDQVNYLKKINFYLIEWHKNGPESLKSIFLKNDFKVLSFHDHSINIGMLYAFK